MPTKHGSSVKRFAPFLTLALLLTPAIMSASEEDPEACPQIILDTASGGWNLQVSYPNRVCHQVGIPPVTVEVCDNWIWGTYKDEDGHTKTYNCSTGEWV